eukprot:gene12972-13101_t
MGSMDSFLPGSTLAQGYSYTQDVSFMQDPYAQMAAGGWPSSTAAEYAAMMQAQQYPSSFPAAAGASGATSGAAPAAASGPASLQPVTSKQEPNISMAAVQQAAAVNQAADMAAEDALRVIAAAQQTMHAAMLPDMSAAMMMDSHLMGGLDDDGTGSRRRSTRSMMPQDHQGAAALLAVAHGANSAANGNRPNKGLRHFSMKVCEKVESKGTTSYNEVADELVAELKDGTMEDGICYDEKNIRRRVYDAINVLMALDIIAKEKKAIIWKGFPANRGAAQQVQRVQNEQLAVLSEVSRKTQYLADLVEQQKALKFLLDRNTRNVKGSSHGTALHLPFILVQSKPDATVEVQISKDMQDVQFNFFNYPFEIHDDALVLRKMLEHDSMQKLAATGAAGPMAADDDDDHDSADRDSGPVVDKRRRLDLSGPADEGEGQRGQAASGAMDKGLGLPEVRSSGSIHANQGGISVSDLPEQSGLQMDQRLVLELIVENGGHDSQHLLRVHQVRPLPGVTVGQNLEPEGLTLPPGSVEKVLVEVQPAYPGILCTLIIFDFGRFLIARELRLEVDPAGHDPSLPDISASAPYQRKRFRLPPAPAADYEPGEREKRPKVPWQKPPRSHNVPIRLRQLLSDHKAEELQAELAKYKNTTELTAHLKKLHLLTHLEELQQEVDVRLYDMSAVTMLQAGRYLSLQIPGLAEARPSVLRGDALYVSIAGYGSAGKEWQGFVHAVQKEEVLLRFNARFHNSIFLPGQLFDVRFAIKRTSFVFMHEALDVAERGLAAAAAAGARPELLLPPAEARAVPGKPLQVTHWYNSSIADNPEQQQAVRCVLTGTSGHLPFIIWGPPGTGKTSTLVEAAAQVLHCRQLPTARLLLVAPSNLAADLLADRLLSAGCPPSSMLRVCAFSRPKEDLKPELLKVTKWDDVNSCFRLPQLDEVLNCRIRVVVVTPLIAAKLHALGVPAGHFSHIMFDEAGHAEEPLALCALAGLTGPDTSVTLAGDPKQLGPVIHSKLAKDGGLSLSLLERLATSMPYAAADTTATVGSGGTSPATGLIMKLVRNYRSHPCLLKLPSQMFYGGELQACAHPELTDSLLHWQELPNNG